MKKAWFTYGILWQTIRWSRCDYVTCSQVTQIIPWRFQLRGRPDRQVSVKPIGPRWPKPGCDAVTQWPSPGKHPVDHHWSRHHRWLMIRHCNNIANRGNMWKNVEKSFWLVQACAHFLCNELFWIGWLSIFFSQINGWSDGWQCAPIIIQYLDRYLTPSRHL